MAGHVRDGEGVLEVSLQGMVMCSQHSSKDKSEALGEPGESRKTRATKGPPDVEPPGGTSI